MPPEVADRGDDLSIAAAEAAAVAAAAANDDPEATAAAAELAAKEVADKAAADKETADKAAADTAARDEKGRFIPKSRFDEQVAKERTAREAAERALADLQSQIKAVDTNADLAKIEEEITALEKAHAKALLEGDADVAAELAGQIRFKERNIQIAQQTDLSNRAKNEAREDVRMDLAIERLEATYPALNQNSEEFDQDLTDFVLATQLHLIQVDKMSPSQALIAASQRVMAKFSPPAAAKEDAKGLAAAKVAGDRKAAQVAKNIETAAKQPASMKESGIDSDKAGFTGDLDVEKMTAEEFAALPEATKSRLRGDLLE